MNFVSCSKMLLRSKFITQIFYPQDNLCVIYHFTFFFKKSFVCLLHQFRNKFKINRYPSLPITPKGVMNEIHYHIFYQYITSDNVNFLDLWSGRPQGFAPTDKSIPQMNFPTITNYAL